MQFDMHLDIFLFLKKISLYRRGGNSQLCVMKINRLMLLWDLMAFNHESHME